MEPSSQENAGVEDPLVVEALRQRNSRYGLWLFSVYLSFYIAFMAITVLWPAALSAEVFLGMNLAVAFGFWLIGSAAILAFIYLMLCQRPLNEAPGQGKGA